MKNIFTIALLLMVSSAWAGGWSTPSTDQKQKQYMQQQQKQKTNVGVDNQVDASSRNDLDLANNLTVENSAAGGSADNEGNSLSVESNYESGPGDLILVPNNNTEGCLRVIGLAWGDKDASAMLGFPFRSKACDFEGSGDDAFAQGQAKQGWFWKCQSKNLYKRFKEPGKKYPLFWREQDKLAAQERCQLKMEELYIVPKDDPAIGALEEEVELYKQTLDAVRGEKALQQSHTEVCKESLESCEATAYGRK